ncbi:hypothetical protein E4T38_03787 [Aureobasidium subglaciale]|nr:hypothetical protein E4T38_03787 [Aureobasidium subglaciale]KAI5217548.1 hypothetical protein E4T41_08810 [Aureobasidium subglaciale]KAI5225425.1 hypothetical protein E4T40_03562 [Aureobasidium subglaciale]KAI5255076.1 hypothetical protein E4T46_08844 [Aureobasidium subglaciale]
MPDTNQDPRQQTPLPTQCTSTSRGAASVTRQASAGGETATSRSSTNKRRRIASSPEATELRARNISRLRSFEDIASHQDLEDADQTHRHSRSDAGDDDDGEAENTMSMARKIYSLDQQQLDGFAVSAIPGAEAGQSTSAAPSPAVEKYPVAAYLTNPFPAPDVVVELLDEYFASVHWFSLVIYEPKFRESFMSIRDNLAEPSQKSFLVLLSTILGMAAWYRSQRPEVETGRPSRQWKQLSSDLFKNADNELINIMDQNSISAIQTLILLGSYYCYHGRPNLSFSMLGASVRTAQALGLHREPSRASFHDAEERKRVWWTIYTWDM